MTKSTIDNSVDANKIENGTNFLDVYRVIYYGLLLYAHTMRATSSIHRSVVYCRL